MTTVQELSDALEPLRPGLTADGADLVVDRVDGNEAVVRLTVSDPTCLDCILPTDHLQSVVGEVVRSAGLAIETITLLDPRADGGRH